MRNRSLACVVVIAPALLLRAASGVAGQNGWEVPFHDHRHFIVVEASIGRMSGLRFIVDTAATCSLLDKRIVKALGLKPLPGKRQFLAYGQLTEADRYRIPALQIGPVFAMVYCLGADLSTWGADGLIGLDFLRQQIPLASCETHEVIRRRCLTFGFQTHRLCFGLEPQLKHTVPLETPNRQIVVAASIYGHPVRLAVDTGAQVTTLFKPSLICSTQPLMTTARTRSSFAGEVSGGKDVLLPSIMLGDSRWENLIGILADLPSEETDGVLSISQLDLKILHFDFERNLMSWNK